MGLLRGPLNLQSGSDGGVSSDRSGRGICALEAVLVWETPVAVRGTVVAVRDTLVAVWETLVAVWDTLVESAIVRDAQPTSARTQ